MNSVMSSIHIKLWSFILMFPIHQGICSGWKISKNYTKRQQLLNCSWLTWNEKPRKKKWNALLLKVCHWIHPNIAFHYDTSYYSKWTDCLFESHGCVLRCFPQGLQQVLVCFWVFQLCCLDATWNKQDCVWT